MRSKIPTAILLAEFYSTQQYPVPVYQAMNAIKRRGGYIYDVVHRMEQNGYLQNVKGFGYLPTGKQYIHKERKTTPPVQVRRPPVDYSHADFVDACLFNCDSIDTRKAQITAANKRLSKLIKGHVFDSGRAGDSLWSRMQ